MSVASLIRALVKKTGGVPAPEFRMLRVKHLKPGEKLPKDFLNKANRVKAGEKLPKGYGQKPKANTKRQEEIARDKAAKVGSKTMKKDTKRKPIVKKLIGGIIGSGAKMAAKRAQARVRAEVARKKREARKKMLEKKAKTEAQNIATNKKTRNTRRRGRIAVARQRQERKKSEEGITKPQTGTVLDKTNLIKVGEEAKKPSPILTGRGRAKTTGDKDKVTTTATEEKARKNIGNKATDLMTPSSVSTPGSGRGLTGATPANEGGVRGSQVAAQTNKEWNKALVKKEKALEKYIKKRDSITDRAKKLQFVNESRTTVTALKASIKDMKKRKGPRVQKNMGGPIVKRKRPGTTKPDWMKGLSKDRIKEMLGGPKPSGERRTKIKKKKKPTQVAKVTVKKIPTVPMDPSLSATFRKGGKGGSKSRQPKKFIRKSGGPVVKKMGGGKVYNYKKGTGSKTIKGRMSGNDVVAGCYD